VQIIKNLGTVEHQGATIYLQQEAYNAAEQGQQPYYRARGMDEDGNEYTVTWQITDEFRDLLKEWEETRETRLIDEGNACDWDVYTVEGPSLQDRVDAAQNLRHLASILNSYDPGEDTDDEHMGPELGDLIDLASLPTFGGPEPEPQHGLWSWDDEHLLFSDEREGFVLVRRDKM
jgi:hypothetical protein